MVIIIDANIDAVIPIINVTAKPLIAPVPNIYRNKAAIRVVTFESKIVANADLKPLDIEYAIEFPLTLSTSLILSYIKTFASTAIPIVSIKPAIPGNVRVALNTDKSANIKYIARQRAMFAKKPNIP